MRELQILPTTQRDRAGWRQNCQLLRFECIVSKRKGSPYRSGRSPDWLKMKNPDAPAVKREAEEIPRKIRCLSACDPRGFLRPVVSSPP
jgi:hypothetical protein